MIYSHPSRAATLRLNAIMGAFKLNWSQINVQLIKTNSSVKQICAKSPSTRWTFGVCFGSAGVVSCMCKPVCVKITRDDKITSTDGSRSRFRLHDIYGWYTIYTKTRIASRNFLFLGWQTNDISSLHVFPFVLFPSHPLLFCPENKTQLVVALKPPFCKCATLWHKTRLIVEGINLKNKIDSLSVAILWTKGRNTILFVKAPKVFHRCCFEFRSFCFHHWKLESLNFTDWKLRVLLGNKNRSGINFDAVHLKVFDSQPTAKHLKAWWFSRFSQQQAQLSCYATSWNRGISEN